MTMDKDISLSRDEVADPDVIDANAHAALLADPQPAAVSPPPVPQAAGSSRFHESARAQVQGAATYVDDIPEIKGTLQASPISDMRASGAYRSEVLGNLLQRYWLESQGVQQINLESFVLEERA